MNTMRVVFVAFYIFWNFSDIFGIISLVNSLKYTNINHPQLLILFLDQLKFSSMDFSKVTMQRFYNNSGPPPPSSNLERMI
jgi:hypothetical protein